MLEEKNNMFEVEVIEISTLKEYAAVITAKDLKFENGDLVENKENFTEYHFTVHAINEEEAMKQAELRLFEPVTPDVTVIRR